MRKLLLLIALLAPMVGFGQLVAEYNFVAVTAAPGDGDYGMNGFFLDTDGRGVTVAGVKPDTTYFFDSSGKKFIIRSKSGSSPFALGVDPIGHASSPVTGVGQLTDLTPNGLPYTSGGVSDKVRSLVSNSGVLKTDSLLNESDGSETKITAGFGIEKSGTGTIGDPYVVSADSQQIVTPYALQTAIDAIVLSGGGIGEINIWSVDTTYAEKDMSIYDGKVYVSLGDVDNIGNRPDTSTTFWVPITIQNPASESYVDQIFSQGSGVTAGSYTSANITVDSTGKITEASSGTGGTGISAVAGELELAGTELTNANTQTHHEIPFSRSPAFVQYPTGSTGFSQGAISGDATVAYRYNNAIFSRGSGYYDLQANTGSVTNMSISDLLPTEYISDTSKYVVLKIKYRRSGTADIKVYQYLATGAGGATETNNTNVATNTSGVEATAIVVRKIKTNTGLFRLLVSTSAGGEIQIGDVQMSVIDYVNAFRDIDVSSAFVVETANGIKTISNNQTEDGLYVRPSTNKIGLADFEEGRAISFLRPFRLLDSTSFFSQHYQAGSMGGTSTIERLDDRIRVIAEGGNVLNLGLYAFLPNDYIGDTNSTIRVKVKYQKHGSTPSIKLWQRNTAGTYTIVNTNILTETEGYIEVEREIASSTINRLYAFVDVTSGDSLDIFDIDFQIYEPFGTYYEAPAPAADWTWQQVDTTVSTVYVVDGAGTIGVDCDYNRLDSCLWNIGDGENGAWKKVIVKAGDYDYISSQLQTSQRVPQYVTIEGESKKLVRITADGPSTPESGTTEDIFIPDGPCIFRNLTLIATDVKYCFHEDFGGDLYVLHEDVDMYSTSFAVGAGYANGDYILFKNCSFTSLNNSGADRIFNVHGRTGEGENQSIIRLIDCYSDNMSFGVFSENDTGENTIIEIDNFKLESIRSEFQINKSSFATDSVMRWIYRLNDFDVKYQNNTEFPDTTLINPSCLVKVWNDNATDTLFQGTPVEYTYSLSGNSMPVDTLSGTSFDLVTYRDILPGKSGYAVRKGKAALSLAQAGTYSDGDYVKIENEVFVPTSSRNEAQGVVIEAKTLASEGLMKIYFLN